jgi:transcriptional regulator with XRE-family HTH domain
MTRIREARRNAGLRQRDVGEAVGRSGMWMSFAERGKLELKRNEEAAILRAIARLARYKTVVRKQREALVADLRLPATRTRAF